MSRIVKDIIKGVPENVQPVLEMQHLNRLLGLKVDSSIKPKLGNMWNKVVAWPIVSAAAAKRAS